MENKQSWRGSLILAAVGISGTLLGAIVPHFLTTWRESTAAFQSQQREAYVGYLNALDKERMAKLRFEEAAAKRAEASALKAQDKQKAETRADEDEALANQLSLQFELEAGAALRRVAIYGDERVVAAIAAYSRAASTVANCGPYWKADIAMWQAMREATLGRGRAVNVRDLAEVALRCKSQPET